MEFEVVELPGARFAYVEHRGAYYKIGSSFRAMAQQAGALGLFGDPDAKILGVYLSDVSSVAEEALVSWAGVTVSNVANIGALSEGHIEGGRFLKVRHIGSFSRLMDSWTKGYDEIRRNDEFNPRPAPPFEHYVSDHDSTPEAELITDIYIPIA